MQVRMIASALVEVGHGRISPSRLLQLLEAGDRAGLGVEAAPASGLVLQQVFYEFPAWLSQELRQQSMETGK
jgi:tRNA U38,U39,U40 pseudouridine synthase TruA